MRIFCSNCGKEVQNKEVCINPCIKSEKIDGKDHYFAVADIRNMCEKCGYIENIIGVSVEIKPNDIIDFLQKRIETVDKCGVVKEKTPEADSDMAIRNFMMKAVHMLVLKYGNGSLENITVENITDDLTEVYENIRGL
jgi:histidinol phosphatase-like PHP family hydrolase